MTTTFHPFGGQTYTLGSAIGSTDTTILLSSFLEPVSGVAYTMALLNTDIAYGTIAPKTSSSEFISFTGITQNSDGTATLTGVTRGLAKKYPFTTSSTFKLPHAGQSQFIISDAPQLFEKYAVKSNDETIDGQWTFSTFPVTPATPDASDTVKGMTKLSIAPASASNPIAYGANEPAIAFIPTTGQKDALAGTQGVPSSTNKYVTSDNVSSDTTDQTQVTQDSTIEVGEADATGKKNIVAQSFIPVKTKIKGVKLYKTANTGTFTGTVTVTLQADTAGSPSGSALATQTITNVSYQGYAVGEFEVLFTSEYASLVAGSLYWIVVDCSTDDNSNHPNLGTNTAGGYASGSVKYKNATDGWVAVANIDLYFKTLEGLNSQVVKTNTGGKIESVFYDISEMPIPVFYQRIAVNGLTSSGNLDYSTSSSDGSVFFTLDNSGSELKRFARDTKTRMYIQTHTVGTTPAGAYSSMVIVGSYLYIFCDLDPFTCYRYDLATGANETLMTIPSIDVAGANYYSKAWTDGTYIYVVVQKASTTCYQLSISGTTLSTVTTGTTAVDVAESSYIIMFDGTNLYQVYNSSSAISIKKFATSFGASFSSTTGYVYNSEGDYSAANAGCIAINASADRMYVGNFVPIYNASAQIKVVITLLPVTKP